VCLRSTDLQKEFNNKFISQEVLKLKILRKFSISISLNKTKLKWSIFQNVSRRRYEESPYTNHCYSYIGNATSELWEKGY
jgi:hypothetical protein